MKKLSDTEAINQFMNSIRRIYRLTVMDDTTSDHFKDAIADLEIKREIGKGLLKKGGKPQKMYAFSNWGEMIDENFAYNDKVFAEILVETDRALRAEVKKLRDQAKNKK